MDVIAELNLLTIFPDDSKQTQSFLKFLSEVSDFERLV
jgi:hypothetical protein